MNPYAKFFRMLRELIANEHTRIIILADANVDQRVFNTPITSQVAVIWVDTDSSCRERNSDIIAFDKSRTSHKVMHYYNCYDPLQCPLLFSYEEGGWHEGIKKANKKSKRQTSDIINANQPTNIKNENDMIDQERQVNLI